MKRFAALVFAALVFFAGTARADEYAKPSLDNFAKTLVRFGAIDIKDDALLDEYAMVTDCGLVKYFFTDDFKWNHVRAAIRESIRMNIGTFPTVFSYVTKLQLDRYDFQERLFRFTEKTTIHNVNSLSFEKENNSTYSCGSHTVKYIPISYRAVFDVPFTIPGLPMSEDDAKALLKRLKNANNLDRIIYVRFNLRVAYIEPLHKALASEQAGYWQSGMSGGNRVMRLDTRLDSVEFYEDENMTKMVYSYTP